MYEDQCKLERMRVEAEKKEKENKKNSFESEKKEGKTKDEIRPREKKEESELSVKNELSEKSEANGKHLVRENKSDKSEKNIDACSKMSDVRQPILVPMYKDVLFITNQIHNQLSCFVVLNRFIMVTHFIQKTSDMMYVVKAKFSTKMFVFDPGGYLNIPTLEDEADSRTNHLQEGGNDMILRRS